MKKIQTGNRSIVEVGNGDEFPDFVDIFLNFFGIKNVTVGRSETHILFFWPNQHS